MKKVRVRGIMFAGQDSQQIVRWGNLSSESMLLAIVTVYLWLNSGDAEINP